MVCDKLLLKGHSELVSKSHKSKKLSFADRLAQKFEILKLIQNDKFLARFVNKVQHENRSAFTLAEVLITLTIIGVIAALTIPNLSKKWSDHADTAKVKQVYSILDNAFKSMLREENASDLTDINWPSSGQNNFMLEKLSEHIKFSKLCYSAKGCAPESYYYKTLHGEEKWGSWTDFNTSGKAILENGMTLAINIWNTAGNRANFGELSSYAGSIRVDINGKKGPNQWGYDVFAFPFNRYGLMRKGITSDYCVDINAYYWSGCTEWILKKENMDYKYLSDEEIKKQW